MRRAKSTAPPTSSPRRAWRSPGASLRGATEATTLVVVRVARRSRSAIRRLAVVGIDPFTQGGAGAATGHAGAAACSTCASRARSSPTFRAPSFAFTRPKRRRATEHADARRLLPRHSRHDAGVRSEAALDAYLAARIARARDGAGEQAAMTRSELARLLDHSVLKPEATRSRHRRRRRRRARVADRLLLRAAVLGVAGRDALVAGTTRCGERGRLSARLRSSGGQGARPLRSPSTDGAGEIDMVHELRRAARAATSAVVAADIEAVVRAVPGVPVKVILETAALTDDEKRLACRLAREAGAAFVKTSTGFHPAGGATAADVRLMRAVVGAPSASRRRAAFARSPMRRRCSTRAPTASAPRPAPAILAALSSD